MTEKSTVSRRTLAKGAAWSVPALSITAAANAAATSPCKPCPQGTSPAPGPQGQQPQCMCAAPCPTCLTGGGFLGVGTSGVTFQSVVALNTGITLLGGNLNLDASRCTGLRFFQPAYALNLNNVQLRWSDGVRQDSTIDPGVGGGTFGSLSSLPMAGVTFPTRQFPNSNVVVFPPGVNNNNIPRPTAICAEITMLITGVPLLAPIIDIQCPQTVCFTLNTPIPLGVIAAGAGTINWTGNATGTGGNTLPA